MDELYGNAWESGKAWESSPHEEPAPSWNVPSPGVSHDHNEPELEWTPDAPISWTDTTSKPGPLWVEPSVEGWGSSPQPTPIPSSSPVSTLDTPTDAAEEEEFVDAVEQPEEDLSIPSPQPPTRRSPSPDPFGKFESGDNEVPPEVKDEGWGSSLPAFDVPDTSSPWEIAPPRASLDEDAAEDEWQAAKREKQKLDKKVPPEILADIINSFHEFAQGTWPELEKAAPDETWMKGWRSGLDSVEGLDALVNTVIPERTFLPRVQFGKTNIAKNMSKSLRLSKHLPITRMSPMSHFILTKGHSSDWEAAIKSRLDVIPDDMPAGWRILENKEEVTSVVDPKAKKAGMFSSFWGRRGSSSTSAATVSNETKQNIVDTPTTDVSPSPPPIAPVSINNPAVSHSPRPSVDGRQSLPPIEKLLTPVLAPVNEAVAQTNIESVSDPLDFFTPEPAPSAVSRFLTRFSRPKTSPRDSMAPLSSDDLDFLSESAPSAMDEPDEDDIPLAQKKLVLNNGLPNIPPQPFTSMMPNANTISLDDDFAAFFDSPIPGPATQTAGKPLQPKPLSSNQHSNSSARKSTLPPASTEVDRNSSSFSAFMLPPPPSSRSQTPIHFPPARMSTNDQRKTMAPVPFLPPPPSSSSSRSGTPALPSPTHSSPKHPPPNIYDDDEFSDFLSSANASARPLYSNTTPSIDSQFMPTPIAVKHPFMSGASPIDPVDSTDFDFDDFMPLSSPSTQNSPQPPTPPAKPTRVARPPANTKPRPVSWRRSITIEDHSHTMDLLEAAAARKGQWPAPPSPSVQVLTPPPLPKVTSNHNISLLGTVDEQPPQPQMMTRASESLRSVVSPVGPSATGGGLSFTNGYGSVNQNAQTASLMDFGDFGSSASTIAPVVANKLTNGGNSSAGGGGLSAQDLSFFEGM